MRLKPEASFVKLVTPRSQETIIKTLDYYYLFIFYSRVYIIHPHPNKGQIIRFWLTDS